LALLTIFPGVAFAAETASAAGLVMTVQATRMTDAQIREKLKADGYTDVQVIYRDKDYIHAKVTKNGKTVKLTINVVTGAVIPDNDND
jgi:hypothetical protein